jgi:hypothetical protein
VFKGEEKPAKEWECVLIYDEATQTFTLEKLDSLVNLNFDVKAQSRTRPVASRTFPSSPSPPIFCPPRVLRAMLTQKLHFPLMYATRCTTLLQPTAPRPPLPRRRHDGPRCARPLTSSRHNSKKTLGSGRARTRMPMRTRTRTASRTRASRWHERKKRSAKSERGYNDSNSSSSRRRASSPPPPLRTAGPRHLRIASNSRRRSRHPQRHHKHLNNRNRAPRHHPRNLRPRAHHSPPKRLARQRRRRRQAQHHRYRHRHNDRPRRLNRERGLSRQR